MEPGSGVGGRAGASYRKRSWAYARPAVYRHCVSGRMSAGSRQPGASVVARHRRGML